MRGSLLDRARDLIGSKTCTAALAIVPLATAAARPARGQPAVLFGFNSNATGISVDSGTGYCVSNSPNPLNFTGATQADGSVAFNGSLDPTFVFMGTGPGGSGGGFIDLLFGGSVSGAINPGDNLTAVTDFTASVTGGTLTYGGISFGAASGSNTPLIGSDVQSPPSFTGASFTVHDQALSTSSGGGGPNVPSGGGWVMDLLLHWTGYTQGVDTLTITMPQSVLGWSPRSAWMLDGGGDWQDPSNVNWSNGVPNGVGAVAEFMFPLSATATVSTSVSETLGTLRFNSANMYVLAGTAGASLTMQTSFGSALIDVQGGTHRINLPLTLASDTTISVADHAGLLITAATTINSGVTLSQTTPTNSGVTYSGALNNAGTYNIGIASTVVLQGGGTDTGTFSLSTAATLQFAGGTHALNSSVSPISGVGFVQITAGTVNVGASTPFSIDAGQTLSLSGSGALNAPAIVVHGTFNFTGGTVGSTALTLDGGGTMSLSAGANKSLNLTALSIDTAHGSKLDLSNNALNVAASLANVRAFLQNGAVYSSAPGGTLGYADAGSGQIKVRFTLLGDSDLDGRVNVADLANLAGNFGKTSNQVWISGDFDYNANVNVADLADLAGNFGKSLPGGIMTGASADSFAAAAAVPEPSCLPSLGLAAAAVFASIPRARRRRCRAQPP
jgi:hypothetical protein